MVDGVDHRHEFQARFRSPNCAKAITVQIARAYYCPPFSLTTRTYPLIRPGSVRTSFERRVQELESGHRPPDKEACPLPPWP